MPLNGFDYSVSRSDFTSLTSRPTGQNEDAQIHPEMSFSNFQLARKGSAVTVTKVDMNISLVATDCWAVSRQMTNDLLKHEQGHYDILALSARELYNKIIHMSANSPYELQVKVTDLQEKSAERVNEADERYDKQTEHGKNIKVQKIWDKKINAAKKT